MNYIIAAHHFWDKKAYDDLVKANPLDNFYFISDKKDLKEKLLNDFIAVWNKIMNADRFDLM